MSLFYISIQATYSSTQVALLDKNNCRVSRLYADARASSHLVIFLTDLLSQHSLTLQDLAFIAVDKGPGAFTSLRVAIATVNGIGFTQAIPLIGVDGLDALSYDAMEACSFSQPYVLVSLLNAYNHDVYYTINTVENKKLSVVEQGCKNIEEFLLHLKATQPNNNYVFAGNGFELHQKLIIERCGSNVIASENLPHIASAKRIGLMAYEEYLNNPQKNYVIEPNYLKSQYFAVKNVPFSG